MPVLALILRVTAFLSLYIQQKIILSGIHENLESSFRALRVLYTAKDLFNQDGFNKVGVDRIITEAKIPKATFYNIFHSKARLIEMCLTFQTDALKVKVLSIINSYSELMVFDKPANLLLHANLEGFYRLPFKAILKLKSVMQRLIEWLLIIETGL